MWCFVLLTACSPPASDDDGSGPAPIQGKTGGNVCREVPDNEYDQCECRTDGTPLTDANDKPNATLNSCNTKEHPYCVRYNNQGSFCSCFKSSSTRWLYQTQFEGSTMVKSCP